MDSLRTVIKTDIIHYPSFSNRIGSSTSSKSNVDSVMKSYNSRKKSNGKFDEDLNGAIEQFETISAMFELTDIEMARAFPAILDGSAFTHYPRTFHKRNPTYQEQIDEFRMKYIGDEQQQRLLQLWQKPSLTEAMRVKHDKSELEVFRDFTYRLSSIQKQLHISYHQDRFLRDKLMIAADISNIHRALLDNVPETSDIAMQRIAARLSSEPRSAGANIVYSNPEEINYSIGRSYGGQAQKHLKGYGQRKKSSSLSRKLASVSGCWVCKRQHRARDNHTQQEVMEAVNRIKRSQPDATFNCTMGSFTGVIRQL